MVGPECYEVFSEGFRNYKTNPKASIDEYVKSIFKSFFGSEDPVCYLEVQNFIQRKQLLMFIENEVQPRHQDRYASLIQTYFRSCENKPRTKAVDTSEKDSQGDQLCVICYKKEDLFRSKCKHLACWSCWQSWLENTLECPQCRARCRKN